MKSSPSRRAGGVRGSEGVEPGEVTDQLTKANLQMPLV